MGSNVNFEDQRKDDLSEKSTIEELDEVLDELENELGVYLSTKSNSQDLLNTFKYLIMLMRKGIYPSEAQIRETQILLYLLDLLNPDFPEITIAAAIETINQLMLCINNISDLIIPENINFLLSLISSGGIDNALVYRILSFFSLITKRDCQKFIEVLNIEEFYQIMHDLMIDIAKEMTDIDDSENIILSLIFIVVFNMNDYIPNATNQFVNNALSVDNDLIHIILYEKLFDYSEKIDILPMLSEESTLERLISIMAYSTDQNIINILSMFIGSDNYINQKAFIVKSLNTGILVDHIKHEIDNNNLLKSKALLILTINILSESDDYPSSLNINEISSLWELYDNLPMSLRELVLHLIICVWKLMPPEIFIENISSDILEIILEEVENSSELIQIFCLRTIDLLLSRSKRAGVGFDFFESVFHVFVEETTEADEEETSCIANNIMEEYFNN